jgi:hypothetical protein
MLTIKCAKCNLETNTFNIDASHDYEYLLDDGSTIPFYLLNIPGWCNSCGKVTRVYSGLTLTEIKNSITGLQSQYKSFFGGIKKMSTYDQEKYDEYQKLLKLLSNRNDLSKRCFACGSHEVFNNNDRTFPNDQLKHKNCGGRISIEYSNVKINLRKPSENSRYTEVTKKVFLLDANDTEVGYRTKKIKVAI